MTTQRQYKAMSDACQRGTMPELPPSPTWDINTPINDLGSTILHIACRHGHESVVGQLLAVGASRDPPIDPSKPNGFGVTPLRLAASQGHEAVVRMLVARPDVDVNKECPLASACRCRHMGVVVALLECPRVDVNLVARTTQVYQSINGQTALHVACEEGFVEGVKVLLKVNGIDTNCKNGKGETPLDVATRKNHTNICNLLMDHNASRIVQPSKPTFPPPQQQAPPTATTTTAARNREITTETQQQSEEIRELNTQLEGENAKNLKLLHDGRQLNQERFDGSTAKNHEIKELKARITQLEEENTKNLKLLHDERQLNQKRFDDSTAKIKELMEQISTLEEESAENLKIFCDERASDQNHTNHMMSHVEQGGGTWCNILPENNNNNCKCLPVRIVFEDLASFDEIVCASCPLQMVVKIIISRKFGVEPTQQLIFIVGSDNNSGVEELLSDPSRTLEEIHQQQQGNCSSTNRVVVSIQVRIKSSMTIQEKDLKVVSTLGVGSYGTVFKCSLFLPHNNTAAATSSSSSTSSEITTTTTSLVAVKSLHESIKSEFNITRFQQEALISSSLRHPNIVRCLGTCITSTGSLWIVSELMELSLRQLLHHKSLTFVEVVAISSGIAKGMTALHLRNIMHRDLSSNNVLLDSCGTPKIADFGVSRASVGNALPGGHRPTALGTFTNGAGTPIYLPPQMHSRHYGIQGDMWEFAVLLSELLQGTVPEVTLPKSFAKMGEFMKLQRSSLSSPEISEVDRLCGDVGDMPIAECLSRRIAIISALRRDPKMNNNNNNEHRACVGLFSLVVESCLSILEINRPPFPAIEKMLMTCAEMAFTTTSSSPTGTRAPTTATTASTSTSTSTSTTGSAPPSLGSTPWPSSATTTEHIATCLAGIVASLLPDSNS
ncbi:serine/threonine-protein kinase STY46 [Pelomyxa schiedti]|nr:serine/threonine-protein kinase STY46 [Pelomyxa schiedti]